MDEYEYQKLTSLKPYVIGLGIREITTVFGVVDALGNIIYKDKVFTCDYADPTSFVFDVCDRLQPMVEKCGGWGNIKAMGISSASGNNITHRIEDAANLPWKGKIAMASMFQGRLGISVALVNDCTAAAMGEIPVGAVIVKDGEVVGRGHNSTETDKDPTCHAEIMAIRAAAAALGGWRLIGCDMYVTAEPCSMCAGAIVLARIERLFVGTPDPKAGACGSLYNIVRDERLNHQPGLINGVLQSECSALLKEFFAELRSKKKTDRMEETSNEKNSICS